MRFSKTDIADCWLISVEPHLDDRGLFARTYCDREFAQAGIEVKFVQCNTSYSVKRATLRGMHFQRAPHEEGKLVRCTQGAIFDVILDLRPGSPTFLKWQGFGLTALNRDALYLPAGIAHGFQTLSDASEVFYQMTTHYVPEAASGVRWDDPAFAIRWPLPDPILSDRDRTYPRFSP